jgi:DNA repair exonuclease SbcCD ATPase subunit
MFYSKKENDEMSFWSNLGNIAKNVGKKAAQGGKWALDHAEQIADAAEVATNVTEVGVGIYDQISDAKERKRTVQSEQEYYAQLEKRNEDLHDRLNEIHEEITQLEEVWEKTFQTIEKKYDIIDTGVQELKIDVSTSITKLQTQINQSIEENIGYRKKLQGKLVLSNILLSLGIIIAVIIGIIF